MKKVVFCFPWKVVSGGPYFLCQLADDLARTGLYEVFYIDYYNGLSDDILNDFRVRKIPYTKSNIRFMEIFPDEPVVLIIPVYWAHAVPRLHPDSKILFINWHNECITALANDWKPTEGKMEELLELVADTDSICFCDIAHWEAQSKYGYFKERYLPIIVSKSKQQWNSALISENKINIAIFGRISGDKVYAYIDLIYNISNIIRNRNVNIHFIGEGQFENLIFSKHYPDNIHIIRYGTLELNKALAVISNHADILFAMGKSVLDGASIGIPTVIIPNEVVPFHCDKYVFLHESKGYALGWSIKQIEALDLSYHSLNEILEMIYTEHKKPELGKACRDYCIQNHISNIAFLKDAIESTSLTYAQIIKVIHTPLGITKTSASFPSSKIFYSINRVLGSVKKIYSISGIPFITVTERDPLYDNVFFLFFPLLQIQKDKKQYIARLLILTWIRKAIIKASKYIPFPKKKEVIPQEKNKDKIQEELRKRIENKLASGQKIKVCLFEPRIACWQFGKIYDLLLQSGIFEPVVVVVPFPTMGDDMMIEYMDTTYEALRTEGYQVIKGYDKKTGVFLDIKKELDPDAVFYSMYWRNHFQENSYITNFEDIYTFLYPYLYDTAWFPERAGYNHKLENKVTRFYLPTVIHKGIAEDNMDNKAINTYVTGCPKFDYFLDKSYQPKEVWKKNGKKKRVIWAPHHTLVVKQPYAQLCAFLDLHEFMLEIAEQYQDLIQFAFKPHPMLKPRLTKLWGKRKVEEYYNKWQEGSNTQLEDGKYFDLFLTSDAMILDSVSFVSEYMVIDKPTFFTYGKDTRFRLNRFGRALMEVSYKNDSADTLFLGIKDFLDRVVLSEIDEKKEEREKFVKTYMHPRDNKTAAENIFDDMCRVILKGQCIEDKIDWGRLGHDKICQEGEMQ